MTCPKSWNLHPLIQPLLILVCPDPSLTHALAGHHTPHTIMGAPAQGPFTEPWGFPFDQADLAHFELQRQNPPSAGAKDRHGLDLFWVNAAALCTEVPRGA